MANVQGPGLGDLSAGHFAGAVNISIEALKALLLINSGAAGALIALTAKNRTDFSYPTVIFGIGAIVAIAAFFVAYFSQLSYANSVLATEKQDSNMAKEEHDKHMLFNGITIILAVLSLIMSCEGAYFVWERVSA